MVVAARATAVAARATVAADWETMVAAIAMAGLARATVSVGLARRALARRGRSSDGGGFERTIPGRVPSLQHRDLRDQHDESRRFCAGVAFQRLLRARLPRQKISCAARRHPVSPAQRKQILSCAQEVRFACKNAGWLAHLECRPSTCPGLRWRRVSLEHLLVPPASRPATHVGQ